MNAAETDEQDEPEDLDLSCRGEVPSDALEDEGGCAVCLSFCWPR